MKKLVALLAGGLMVLSVVGCGNKNQGAQNSGTTAAKVNLTVYQNKAEVTAPMQAYADKWGAENNATVNIKTCTGECDYGAGMKSDINAGQTSDIFIIEGDSGYKLYKDIMLPLEGEAWVGQTDYAYEKEGHVYGYPVAVEGYGLAYNKEVLDKAGVDVATLTTLSGYKAAFEKVDAMKKELGLTGVVAMVTTEKSAWVAGNHNFAGYLSSGLASDDTTVIDQVLAGKTDSARLHDYANWVKLLFDFTDKKMLTVSSADDQMAEFGAGKYAFLHQGTWADLPVKQAGGAFEMGFAPHASMGEKEATALFAGAPSYYCINKDSKNIDLSKKFLNDLCSSDAGQKMVVEEVQLVSAFKNNSYKPSAPLAAFLAQWVADGKPAISFTNQYSTPDGFNTNTLGPIYSQFAKGDIDQAKFEELFTNAIATLAK